MLRFTLRQIEYAVAIWDHGSVAAASAHLRVAQPTLSAALAKLEEQVGLQLFIRHHAQGVSPSPSGLRFLAEARNLLTHAQDLQRDHAWFVGFAPADIVDEGKDGIWVAGLPDEAQLVAEGQDHVVAGMRVTPVVREAAASAG